MIYAKVTVPDGDYDPRYVWIGHRVGKKLPTVYFGSAEQALDIVGISDTERDKYDNGLQGFLDDLYSDLTEAIHLEFYERVRGFYRLNISTALSSRPHVYLIERCTEEES